MPPRGVDTGKLVADARRLGAAGVDAINVPDGPPPARLELQGDALRDVDPEDVRRALQLRWDVFCGFAPEVQAALRAQSLERVNAVLGKMKVEDAEELVKMLDMAGILNFSEHGIRDETGKGADDGDDGDADEEEAAADEVEDAADEVD